MNTRPNYQLEQQRRFAQEKERRFVQPPVVPVTGPPAPVSTRNTAAAAPEPIVKKAPAPIQLAPVNNNNNYDGEEPPVVKAVRTKKTGSTVPRKPKEAAVEPVSSDQVGLRDEQRSTIQRYIELDDEINELNARIKQLRNERKELEDDLIVMLNVVNKPVREGDVVLATKKKAKQETVNQKFLAEKLAQSGELIDATKADSIIKNIYKNRSKTEDYALVRKNVSI